MLGDPRSDLGARCKAEFGEDIFDVAFCCAARDNQVEGDLLVRLARGDQGSDLTLAFSHQQIIRSRHSIARLGERAFDRR
jgi:hypothetical protein